MKKKYVHYGRPSQDGWTPIWIFWKDKRFHFLLLWTQAI